MNDRLRFQLHQAESSFNEVVCRSRSCRPQRTGSMDGWTDFERNPHLAARGFVAVPNEHGPE